MGYLVRVQLIGPDGHVSIETTSEATTEEKACNVYDDLLHELNRSLDIIEKNT